MSQDVQKQVFQYQQYLMEGMSAKDAFNKAFPKGIPTQQDRLKAQAKEQQQQSFGQLGGVLTGALGSKAVYDVVTGKPILGGIFGGGGGAAATEAAKTAATAGTQAATAGGQALSAPNVISATRVPGAETSAPGMFSVGTTGGNVLGGLGVGLGAYGAYQGIKDKNPLTAGLGGGGMVLGLNQLGYTLGPWGVAASIAAPALIAALSGMGDKDRWKEEQSNVQSLVDRGVTGWDQLQATMPKLTRGRSIDELVAIEQANKAAGLHSNEKFARSRNEADLTAEDIWGYSAFGDKYGNDWFGKFSEAERRNIAQQALDAGAVQEGRGQIKIDWTKVPGQQQPAQTQAQNLAPTPYNKAKIKQNAGFGDKLISVLR